MSKSQALPFHVFSDTSLVYKTKRYLVEKLLAQKGPEVTVAPGELHVDYESLVKAFRINFNAYTGTPLVTKHEGAYVVLLGHKAFKEAIVSKQPVKCRLLSNVALKNTLIKE